MKLPLKLTQILQVLPFFDSTVDRWAIEARMVRLVVFLWIFAGLAVLFSASYPEADLIRRDGWHYFKQQFLWVLMGLLMFNGIVHLPLRTTMKLGTVGLFITLAMLYVTYITGTKVNDATRWIALGPVLIQPSELIKPFLVLQAAQLFGHWQRTSWQKRLGWLTVFLIALAGILMQPSLSVTALCGITLWLMALGAGLPSWQMIGSALLGVLAAVSSVAFRDYQRRRVMSFLDPWPVQGGDGYQLVQSLLAVGSGGLGGVGFGLSQQKMFLPIQYTDFIFAIFAEEFGFVGSIALILLVMVFGTLGVRIASKCKDPVVRLVALGSTVLIVMQSFLNIGVATGVLPTTGLPFPFVSYGGNAMLASLAVAGFLIRAGREMSTAEVIPFPRRFDGVPSGDGDKAIIKSSRLPRVRQF
ncbi:MAG: FtsW/RodA/SpoVE family cell cycle protein [Pseudanabaenaceae cyanobacterium]